MKIFRAPIVVASLFMLTLIGCEKEPAPVVPGSLGAPVYPGVSGISLNGGDLTGGWSMYFEEYASYINNARVGYDTATHDPGVYTADYFANGNMLYMRPDDTLSCTYTVSGNQLTITFPSETRTMSFGVTPDGYLRWSYSVTMYVGSDTYRDDFEYLFVRD